MERYEAYKDSGVAWIGEIPEEWEVLYPKKLFVLRKERALPEDVQLTASQKNGIITQEEYIRIENQRVVQVITGEDILKHVEAGDFVISMRSFQGGLEYSTISGKISSAYVMLYPSNCKAISDGYYKHLFKSVEYIQALQSTSNLVRDGQALRYANFVQVYLPYPPICEQQAIADYLNAKTAEVDALVADCEREVELLQEYRKAVISEAVTKGLDPDAPMKDSGIEWIGDIPEGWKTARTKQVCSRITDGSHFSPATVDVGFPYITATNIRGRGIDYSSAKLIDEDSYNQLVQNGCRPISGDVLMVKDGATTGRAGLMVDDEACVILSSVALMRPKLICNSDYLFYSIQSNSFQEQVLVSMSGSAMPRTTLDKLIEYSLALPPTDEQKEIVTYLDTKVAEIDSLIEAKQSMADKLREYRKSLISEAVTGKFKVPGV